MTLLVTGGAGFIGSHFIHYYLQHHPQAEVVNLDSLTYAGNLANVADLVGEFRYHFIQGNINDSQLVSALIEQFEITKIVNFAAESHVDRSIKAPQLFIETNVLGTQNLLQVASQQSIKQFVQISTDEVYGSLGATGQFDERSPLNPSSPYSASKSAADLLVLATAKTYGMHVNITRSCNNLGANQFPEKLIPLMTVKMLLEQPLPMFGTGQDVRDWLAVIDHCRAIDLVLQKGRPSEIYNIGGKNERTNQQIIQMIAHQLHVAQPKVRHLPNRPGADSRYGINATKIQTELGWTVQIPFAVALRKTVDWYLEYPEWWEPLLPKLPFMDLN